LNAARRGRRSPSFAVDEETGDVAVTVLRSTGFLTISAARSIGRCRNRCSRKERSWPRCAAISAPDTCAWNAGDGLRRQEVEDAATVTLIEQRVASARYAPVTDGVWAAVEHR
jgi:hypothetical protein